VYDGVFAQLRTAAYDNDAAIIERVTAAYRRGTKPYSLAGRAALEKLTAQVAATLARLSQENL
jgi:predicted metal-dependent hydrolase